MRLYIRAINHISQARKKLRSFREFVTSNNAGDKRENASDLVEAEHKSLQKRRRRCKNMCTQGSEQKGERER